MGVGLRAEVVIRCLVPESVFVGSQLPLVSEEIIESHNNAQAGNELRAISRIANGAA